MIFYRNFFLLPYLQIKLLLLKFKKLFISIFILFLFLNKYKDFPVNSLTDF